MTVGYTSTPTQEGCYNECQQNQFCNYFTWANTTQICALYSECNGYNETVCADCLTGAKNCSLYDCFTSGICVGGGLLTGMNVENANECLNLCRNNTDCKWFNYEPENNNICVLTDACPTIDQSCSSENCIHGQVECSNEETKRYNIFIAIGSAYGNPQLDHVEVLNTQTLESCPNLPAPYPIKNEVAISMKHQGKIVICGGQIEDDVYTSDCYSYDHNIDQWDLEPFRLEPARFSAASIEIWPDEWLILGGVSITKTLKETQIFKDGQFFQGPDLPIPMDYPTVVMLDKETLFVADGHDTKLNFLLDINTNEWTPIAPRLHNSYKCTMSGTFFNSSANELQVVNIGDYIQIYSPRDDSWQEGVVPYPSDLWYLKCSVVIQQGPSSFVMVSASTNHGYDGDIFHFDESGLKRIKTEVLAIPRSTHIAVPIAEDEFACNNV